MFAITLHSGKIEKKRKKRHTSEVGQYLRNVLHIQCTASIMLSVRQIMDVFHSDETESATVLWLLMQCSVC